MGTPGCIALSEPTVCTGACMVPVGHTVLPKNEEVLHASASTAQSMCKRNAQQATKRERCLVAHMSLLLKQNSTTDNVHRKGH